MRPDVQRNWEWADGYLPEVRRVLRMNAMHLVDFSVAPMDMDTKNATDLLVSVKGGQIAVRVRRPNYWNRYRDLTIRAMAGGRTEIDKILDGFARWYLYGWISPRQRMDDWMLVDLDAVRDMGLLNGRRLVANGDGRTGFVYVPAYELLQAGCLVAHDIEQLKTIA